MNYPTRNHGLKSPEIHPDDEEMNYSRATTDIGLMSGYVNGRFNSKAGNFSNDPQRKILIIGDSFAQDFSNMVAESGAWQDAQIRTVYVPAVCQMVAVGQDISKFIEQRDIPGCNRSPNIMSSIPKIQQADVIILASSWAKWSAELLSETVDNMHIRPDQQLFVVGPKSYRPVDIRKFISLGESGRALDLHRVPSSVSEVNDILRDSLPSSVFIDQIRIVCGVDEECPLVTKQDDLISYDGGHLTREGAAYIWRKLFSESPLMDAR